jgi:Right handed beta helix region
LLSVVVLLVAIGTGLTSGARAETILHVDADFGAGFDEGTAETPEPAGTERRPFTKLQTALEHAGALENEDAVTLLVHPGVYRETIQLQLNPASPRIRVAAVEPGTAVISGAEPVIAWERIGPGLYRAPWPEPLPLSVVPAEWPGWLNIGKPALHREMLFSDHRRLEQVYDFADMRPATFLVDDQSRQVFVRAGPYVEPGRTVMEAARRTRLLELSGAHGLELDGLVFRRAATPMMQSAVEISNSSDVTLRDVTIADNNATGLSINRSDRVSLHRLSIVDNGSTGTGLWQIRGLQLKDVEASRNNWRGETGNFTDWAVAGIKILQVRETEIRNVRAIDNFGPGLWLDTDISGVEVTGADLSGNEGAGLVLEATQGPVGIRGTRIVRNGHGVVAAAASDITLDGNTIACNAAEQVIMTGSPNLPVIDHLTNTTTIVNNTGWTLTGNVISATQQNSLLVGTTMPGENWRQFAASLKASNNSWSHGATNSPFLEPMGRKSDFARWQELVGDQGSVFKDTPDTRCFAEVSDR